jgi:hypothetical protein
MKAAPQRLRMPHNRKCENKPNNDNKKSIKKRVILFFSTPPEIIIVMEGGGVEKYRITLFFKK